LATNAEGDSALATGSTASQVEGSPFPLLSYPVFDEVSNIQDLQEQVGVILQIGYHNLAAVSHTISHVGVGSEAKSSCHKLKVSTSKPRRRRKTTTIPVSDSETPSEEIPEESSLQLCIYQVTHTDFTFSSGVSTTACGSSIAL